MDTVAAYHLDRKIDRARCAALLRGAGLRVDERRPADGVRGGGRRDFLDTFDWRLLEHGWVLELHGGRNRRLVLRSLAEPGVRFSASLPGRDRALFAGDLPEGPLGEHLRPLLGVRALLPVVRVRDATDILQLLDADAGPIARLELEHPAWCRRADCRDALPLPARLALEPAPGCEERLAELRGVVERVLPVRAASGDVLLDALERKGTPPRRYATRMPFRLDASAPMETSLRRILAFLADIMDANVDGIRRRVDTEFLHDFRVAVRRTRTCLGEIRKVFPADRVRHFRDRFAWLGAITGPARDLDVYLLGFDARRAALPEDLGADIEVLRTFLIASRDAAYRRLARQLGGRRYRELRDRWRALLAEPVAGDGADDTADALRPNAEVAGRRIGKLFRKVIDEGRAIDDASPGTMLHALRKDCKKLRYLIEFFRSVLPAAAADPVIGELKALLDELGGFQDCEVQIGQLEGYAADMHAAGQAPPRTLLAMGCLVQRLHARRGRLRAAAMERFAAFDRRATRQRVRAMARG